jgi:hypothetical protein
MEDCLGGKQRPQYRPSSLIDEVNGQMFHESGCQYLNPPSLLHAVVAQCGRAGMLSTAVKRLLQLEYHCEEEFSQWAVGVTFARWRRFRLPRPPTTYITRALLLLFCCYVAVAAPFALLV